MRNLLQACCDEELVIISCAGYYSDDEAILKWCREGEEHNSFFFPEIMGKRSYCRNQSQHKRHQASLYARSRLPRRASIATTALATDVDFVGRASIESGIAKVQNLLSRVSDRTT
ncbi:uncharacterized protein CEXT_655391 [Caerostris extrusa]|uniref:Uncharacterized protein n=1 Tax=Caerostris extrusa TaxID=172846 RepID=A0AAV4U3V9_CAEEX|nr:uncharacterized protein CEXT_655391 [Caerostris extrusa]